MRNLIIAILLLAGLIFLGREVSLKKPQTPQGPSKPQISYFAEEAKVMYFYSKTCGWCQKEEEVLKELAKEGFAVKPMDVGENPSLWQEYQIEGTPTFIASNGERLVGYHDKETLRKFLEKHR